MKKVFSVILVCISLACSSPGHTGSVLLETYVDSEPLSGFLETVEPSMPSGSLDVSEKSKQHALEAQLKGIVRIAPLHSIQSKIDTFNCIATFINPRWILTAAHCFSSVPALIALECMDISKQRYLTTSDVGSFVVHPTHDIVLLRLNDNTLCSQSVQALKIVDDQHSPLISIALKSEQIITFPVLERSKFTVIAQDIDACLMRADSGYPIFTHLADGSAALSAMLLSGTDGCPSTQVMLRLSPLRAWLILSQQ